MEMQVKELFGYYTQGDLIKCTLNRSSDDLNFWIVIR